MDPVEPGFEGWYRAAQPRLLASLTLVCGDVDVAEECVAEALARALERWDRVALLASPTAWVYTVALNVHRRRQRRLTLEQRVLRRVGEPSVVPEPAGEAWAVVRDLPVRQRTAVVLRYVADLPEAEIAQMMGIRRSTVAATLAAARRSLAAVLTDPEVAGA